MMEETIMSNKYAGTQTEKNLEAAFAGESMARNKYTYFASKAKNTDTFEFIDGIFNTDTSTSFFFWIPFIMIS